MSKLSVKDWVIIGLGALLALSAVLSIIFFQKYKSAEGEVVMWNDSTHIYKNMYNEEYLAKNTFIMEVDELKEYNEQLYEECKKLKDNPIVITKTKVLTEIDTVYTHNDSIWGDTTYMAWNWSAADSCWYSLDGTSRIDFGSDSVLVQTIVNNMKVNTEVTLDVIDDGNQLEVIAKSNNPYSNVSEIQSVVIDPTTSPTLNKYFKPKRWGFGPYVGVGVYGGYGYGGNPASTGLQVGVGLSIGFSVHYDLIQW